MEAGGGNEKTLILQWHITARCNLRCRHCYQSEYEGQEPDFDGMLRVLEQYKCLLAKLGRRGHINITGGEPLIREDFFDLLEVLRSQREHFSFGILTNGTMIDGRAAERLKGLEPRFVQISIEGERRAHDNIRGAGSYKAARHALKRLARENIPAIVSFTAHKENYRSFPKVVKMCRWLKVDRVWADRLVPVGSGRAFRDQSLSPEACMDFFRLMKDSGKEGFAGSKNRTQVEMRRALQFLAGNGIPYRCTAGDSLIALMEDGTVYPCRRLPIKAGNIVDSTLEDIYFGSSILKDLREGVHRPEGCAACSYYNFCRGGSRCIAYALTGELWSPDPGCPVARK